MKPVSRLQQSQFCLAKEKLCFSLAASLAATLVWCTTALAAQRTFEGPATAVDGDTLRASAPLALFPALPSARHFTAATSSCLQIAGEKVRLRLLGIDAPETTQSCMDGNGRPYPCGADAKLQAPVPRSTGESRFIGRLVASSP